MKKNIADITNYLENVYNNSLMKYEIMFAEFALLSEFEFHIVKIDKGSVIARCRYNSNNKSFTNVSQISYPPNHYINDFSRANRPKQKLFYASDSENASLAEMIPLWNKELSNRDSYKVTSSLWRTTRILNLIIIPDFNSTSEYNIKVIRKMNPNERKFWEYITNKYKTTSLQDQYIYEFTSAFSNALWCNAINQDMEVDGFMYCNVLLDEYVNIALTPTIIDSNNILPYDIVELEFIKSGLNSVGLPNYDDSGIRKRGKVIDKKIIWD